MIQNRSGAKIFKSMYKTEVAKSAKHEASKASYVGSEKDNWSNNNPMAKYASNLKCLDPMAINTSRKVPNMGAINPNPYQKVSQMSETFLVISTTSLTSRREKRDQLPKAWESTTLISPFKIPVCSYPFPRWTTWKGPKYMFLMSEASLRDTRLNHMKPRSW